MWATEQPSSSPQLQDTPNSDSNCSSRCAPTRNRICTTRSATSVVWVRNHMYSVCLIDRQWGSTDGSLYKKKFLNYISMYILHSLFKFINKGNQTTSTFQHKTKHIIIKINDVMKCNAIWYHVMNHFRISSTHSTVYTWYSSEIHREIMTHGGLARSIYRHGRSPRVCADNLHAPS